MSLELGNGRRVIGFLLATAVFFLLLTGLGAVGAVAAGSTPDVGGCGVAPTNGTNEAPGGNATAIDPRLEDADGEVTVLVRFEPFEGNSTTRSAQQTHTETTQQPFERYANATPSVDLERSFWITNAALVTVDTDRTALADLADRDDVVSVCADDELTLRRSDTAQTDTGEYGAASDGYGYTPGLEQINVPEAWERFHTRGENVSVVVLDSGVDADHPDLEVAGWNDFGADQSAEPVAYDDHGTHVSGTVAGGNASGTQIGVAPDATLLHGAVITDCQHGRCVGYERHILAGIEWAVEEDADVIVMSLGRQGYSVPLLEAVENANEAGTVVVGAVGNQGAGTSMSPGNVYSATSVGAVDDSGSIPSFSSGEEIDTDDAWGDEAPESWPASYSVPDVVAPGVGVKSTISGGEYDTKSGTSMATPHVGGAAALVQSATAAELRPEEIGTALLETATIPDKTADVGSRYGHGIIDVAGAIDEAGTHGSVEGRITDEVTSDPLENATVTITDGETELETTTGADGEFTFTGLPGDRTYTVTVEREGYESATETTVVPADERTTTDVSLAGDGTLEVVLVDAHFETGIETGTVEATGPHGRYPATQVDDGTYRVEHVPSVGAYDVRADAPGYLEHDRSVSITDRDVASESFELQGDAALEVTVETETGTPIENASVSIERQSGATFEPANRTDENGQLDVVVPGTGEQYVVEATAAGFETTAVETGGVDAGTRRAVTVSLSDTVLPTPRVGALAVGLVAVALGIAWMIRT